MLEGTCIAPPQRSMASASEDGRVIRWHPGLCGHHRRRRGHGGGGVTVSFQGAVGPFDAAVIKSDDPTG